MAVVAALAFTSSCFDRSTTDTIAPGHARLALVPRFATVPGGPSIVMTRLEASLTSEFGDSTFAKADFVDGTAKLTFDVRLPGSSGEFVLDILGFDAKGIVVYHARRSYTIKAGNNDDLAQPEFEYAGPDAKVTTIHVAPGPMTLDAGAATTLSVNGTDASNILVSAIRVGWTSRDPAIATVNDSGAVSAKLVKGQTYIVARTPTNVADSVLVTTRGAVALVVANPTSLSIFRGATATVTAELRDPAGNVILDRTATFSSSDDKIASVSAGGVVTAVAVGSANITATIEGKSATIPMTVTSPVAGVELVPSTVTLARPGDSQVLTARVVAAPGASVDGLVPTVTTSDAKVATVGEGRIFAINYGVATITATIENFTATTAVAVVSPLVLTPSKAERLPNGTQTFAVTSGGGGPFTWTVNGIVGGNSTFGTISTVGAYVAPATVPTPATFDVCATQSVPSTTGCASVTINPVPTGSGDVIVFNDDNMFDDGRASDNNIQLFKNLVGFTGDGPRASQTGVMFHRGHNSGCGGFIDSECLADSYSTMYATIRGAGYTITDVDTLTATITSIPAGIKTIFLMMPEATFQPSEINVLKQFAADGGRIVYVGERAPFLGQAGIDVENNFLQSMGAVMRNVGGDYACIYNMDAAHINAKHQTMTGMTGISMACASAVQLGPNDFPLVFDQNDATVVLAAVAKVDLTPLPPSANRKPSGPRLTRAPGAPATIDRTQTGTGPKKQP